MEKIIVNSVKNRENLVQVNMTISKGKLLAIINSLEVRTGETATDVKNMLKGAVKTWENPLA